MQRQTNKVNGEQQQLISLERAFTAAATSSGSWEEALRQLAELTGSARGQLIGIGGPSYIPFNYVTDAPQAALDRFVSIGGGSPEISFRVAASIAAPDRIVSEADYDEAVPKLKSDVYLDFCRDYEMPFGIQANLQSSSEGLIGLAVLRSQQDGRSTAEQRRLFGLAAPIVAKAVKVRVALEQEAALLVAGTLEAMEAAAMVLDGNGVIRGMTPRAEWCLAGGIWLEARRGRLTARHPAERDAFAAAIAKALQGEPPRLGTQTLVLKGADGDEPVAVDIVSLPQQDWSLSYRPRLIVLVRMPSTETLGSRLLQSAFNLTRSEAEVTELLSRGLSRSEIAVQRGSSVATVSAQLKSIFAKLGVTRETLVVAKARDFLGRS